MTTREDARRDAGPSARHTSLVPDMRHATLTAVTALAGCGVLIGFGAALSMCWAVHPLLTVAAAGAMVWFLARLAAHLVR